MLTRARTRRIWIIVPQVIGAGAGLPGAGAGLPASKVIVVREMIVEIEE